MWDLGFRAQRLRFGVKQNVVRRPDKFATSWGEASGASSEGIGIWFKGPEHRGKVSEFV